MKSLPQEKQLAVVIFAPSACCFGGWQGLGVLARDFWAPSHRWFLVPPKSWRACVYLYGWGWGTGDRAGGDGDNGGRRGEGEISLSLGFLETEQDGRDRQGEVLSRRMGLDSLWHARTAREPSSQPFSPASAATSQGRTRRSAQ